MRTFKEDTTLIGVSELRNNFDKILEKAKENRVIIEKRKELKAVLLDLKEYREMEKMLDAVEDIILGYLAKEREEDTELSDYLDIDKL